MTKTLQEKFSIGFNNPKTKTVFEKKKEKYLIKQYNKLLGYQKAFELDLKKINNGGVDLQGQKINSNELVKQKLENIEFFTSNTLLGQVEILENGIIPKYTSKQQKEFLKGLDYFKFENKRTINNGLELKMNGFNKSILNPLDYVDNKFKNGYYTNKVKENSKKIVMYKKTIEKIENNLKNKTPNITIYDKANAIENDLKIAIFDLD